MVRQIERFDRGQRNRDAVKMQRVVGGADGMLAPAGLLGVRQLLQLAVGRPDTSLFASELLQQPRRHLFVRLGHWPMAGGGHDKKGDVGWRVLLPPESVLDHAPRETNDAVGVDAFVRVPTITHKPRPASLSATLSSTSDRATAFSSSPLNSLMTRGSVSG